jgi:Flp pilus assembly protein TadD
MGALRYVLALGAGLTLYLWGCAGNAGIRPRAFTPDPQRAARLNEEGLALVAQCRWSEAEARFSAAVDADPCWGPGYCNWGLTLLQAGKVYDAAWALRHAASLMPRSSQPRANLGLLFEQVGKYGPAEDELRAALRLAPDDVEIVGLLARLHVRAGKHTDETLAWLQTVAAQDDDPAWRDWAGTQLIRITPSTTSQGRNQ